ncbi:hypothetical protein MPRM_14490 [Mycobacterium parmense]|uniref:Uncharacterized protein n=1 Tax=Mycobacterium parmense TaxID=185642 RepID=A0A7I7YQM6_9MYCO|nr:hypothetical protein MPRM_14490 [Mycobacterium parmense]
MDLATRRRAADFTFRYVPESRRRRATRIVSASGGLHTAELHFSNASLTPHRILRVPW